MVEKIPRTILNVNGNLLIKKKMEIPETQWKGSGGREKDVCVLGAHRHGGGLFCIKNPEINSIFEKRKHRAPSQIYENVSTMDGMTWSHRFTWSLSEMTGLPNIYRSGDLGLIIAVTSI